MKYNSDNKNRQSIRLKEYDYSSNGAYFITICVKNRECIFGEIINGRIILSDIGLIVDNHWVEITNYSENVLIDEFIVMPNHIHGIVLIQGLINQTATTNIDSDNSVNSEDNITEKYNLMKNDIYLLGKVIRQFKAKATKIIRDKGFSDFSWQKNYYEHIIRSEKSLEAIRNYIIENPLKWELDRENPSNPDYKI